MTVGRPLPGIAFRAEPSPLADPLPRMDVAAFVGFAARGPLHVPVVVEDVAQFRAIFGDAPRLAWNAKTGAWERACLAGAVADFFAHGGLRCWVVRVAGSSATVNLFPVPGLLQATAAGLAPAYARAGSPGSWSDVVRVNAGATFMPLRVATQSLPRANRVSLTVQTLRGDPLGPGDLLQLDFADGTRAYLRVEELADGSAPAAETGRWQVIAGAVYWFRPPSGAEVLDGRVYAYTPAGSDPGVSARLDATEKRLKILADRLAAEPGAWLSFVPDEGDGRLWLLAGDQAADCVTWQTAWWEGAGGDGNIPLARVARLALTLQTRTLIGPVSGDQKNDRGGVLTMPDLGFSAPHPRFWGYLPDDATLYEQRRGDPEPAAGLPGAGLWPEAMASRFPLAGPEDPDGVFLPLGLVLRSPRPQGVGSRAEGLDRPADAWPGPVPQVADALARDGLVPEGVNEPALTAADWAEFLAQVHLDSNLREVGQASLLAEAFDLRFVQGRRLTGLHSVLPLEEVSLLAMCDAAHRGWRLVAHTEPPEPPPPVPPPSPAPCPDHDLFHDCDDNTTPSGQRLRDTEAARGSDFSRSPAGWRWELLSELEYDPSGLLEIQRAAVEMAAARGDLVIILGLPAHYRTAEALSHRQALGRGLIGLRTTASYAALYHPWLWIRDEDNGAEPPSSSGGRPAGQATLRLTPPEGAACGIIAGRGLTRGAWIAPANQPVRDAIGLSFEPSADEATELYNATVNLISRGAHGFTVMGADTLSDDPDLAPLGVRRLLILLRRLALREGQTYVFAPHSPAFRRRVALGFERQLARMFARGAFAGDNPASAYRVVVDETVNTPEVVALGQFIVELRVAPSRPMTFIVVRLVQAEPQTFTVQEL